MTKPSPEGAPLDVPIDQFKVVRGGRALRAHLAGSYALCFSDEVFDAGALLHVQAGRPGKSANAELTDNTLSMDLLLLDRCLAGMRAIEPQARHWQARFVAHASAQAGGQERLQALRAFIEAALADANIGMVDGRVLVGSPHFVEFDPALRQLRCAAAPG